MPSTVEKRGLALPASPRVGYFRSAGPGDLAWSELLLALFTPVGSRPMRRSFGSEMRTVLFDPNDEEVTDELVELIAREAERQAPNVRVREAFVVARTQDRVSIRIRYSRPDLGQVQETTVDLPKTIA